MFSGAHEWGEILEFIDLAEYRAISIPGGSMTDYTSDRLDGLALGRKYRQQLEELQPSFTFTLQAEQRKQVLARRRALQKIEGERTT